MTTIKLLEQIEDKLDSMNGKRTCRTLNMRAVISVLQECLKARDGVAYDHGGNVANAYSYAAKSTAALAINCGPKGIALMIGTRDAHKGSPTTWATGRSVKEVQQEVFFPRAFTEWHRIKPIEPHFWLTRRTCRAVIKHFLMSLELPALTEEEMEAKYRENKIVVVMPPFGKDAA